MVLLRAAASSYFRAGTQAANSTVVKNRLRTRAKGMGIGVALCVGPPKGGVHGTNGVVHGNIFLNKAFQGGRMETPNDTGLPRDWVVRPAIDLELKQYMLLGYLQRVG